VQRCCYLRATAASHFYAQAVNAITLATPPARLLPMLQLEIAAVVAAVVVELLLPPPAACVISNA